MSRLPDLRSPCVVAVFASLAACARGPAPGSAPAPDPLAVAAVGAAMQHYVALVRRADSDSVAAMYTEDGEMLQPGVAPLQGRAAIRAFLAPFDGHAKVDTATASTLPASVFGDVAFQWGAYHQVARLDAGAPGTFDGRFAAEWRRGPDGLWRLRRLLMQPAPAGGGAP